MLVRKAIDVCGIVQGVGFRPHVYRLAAARGLAGSVINTAAGLTIEIQGSVEMVRDFIERLRAESPPLAHITLLREREMPCNGASGFFILESRAGLERTTLISPDVAVCDDCLRELFDPNDRRYLYPFINCTNCGPRFTIVHDIPYDRALTCMSSFEMCSACRREYEDPADRRFHAQPNACWKCGPRVELWDVHGERVDAPDPITAAADRLHAGEVVAIKGLGGFHLAVDAGNAEAVEHLRQRKRRVEKPFAVMVAGIAAAASIAVLDDAARELVLRPERPIVLLPKVAAGSVVQAVAPFSHYLGVFLPYTPLHHLLFAKGRFKALVMTSGNVAEEPIAIDNSEAVARLSRLADCFLVHDRDILRRCDDSVLRVVTGRPRQLRRSRGYVPVPLVLHDEVSPVLAVGGELKNTICLATGRHAFLSQHIGDLENLEGFRFFEEAIRRLERILDIQPRTIAYDLHPDYFSTRWAIAQTGVQLVGVQHHHAHVVSCMAENHLKGPVIGIALDGTGYGTDGAIWGGEALIAGYDGFERAAHLDYVPMPGAAKAIHEPWRMAVSYLYRHLGRSFLDLNIPFVRELDGRQTESVLRMIDRGVNCPLTSSCGRLFDAVAALAGIRQRVNYEAQAAVELEMAIERGRTEEAYPAALCESGAGWTIDTHPIFERLIDDLAQSVPVASISLRFHLALVEAFARIAELLRERMRLNHVCLSGGAFQNVFLLAKLAARLEASSFDVFTHAEVPPGDGGLSLGQAMVAAHRVR